MKIKLLKKLRDKGRNCISIISVTTEETRYGKIITGMSIAHDGANYRNLFEFGDTVEIVKEKACKIWMCYHIEWVRKKYKKYSRKNK